MTVILLMSFIGLIFGSFLILRLSLSEYADSIFSRLTSNPDSLKSQLNKYTGKKKQNFLKREIAEAQEILRITNRFGMFSLLCTISLALAAVGVCFSILLGNLFLIPIMAVGMLFVPFWYVKLTAVNFKRDLNSELETAMSIITTAYLRSEDIITSVEENVHYLNPPVKQVFEEFLSRIKFTNPDIISGLRAMKITIDNGVFHEWLDALIMCQNDRSLKSTLNPIVAKLSDMRVVNNELTAMVSAPRKEFITMVLLVVENIPLLYALNKSWFNTIMNTAVGQIVLAVSAAAIFISAGFVIKLSKPIEYRR